MVFTACFLWTALLGCYLELSYFPNNKQRTKITYASQRFLPLKREKLHRTYWINNDSKQVLMLIQIQDFCSSQTTTELSTESSQPFCLNPTKNCNTEYEPRNYPLPSNTWFWMTILNRHTQWNSLGIKIARCQL